MARGEVYSGDARQRLAHHYETAVRSLAMLRGFSSLGDSQIGRIVDDAVAGASHEEKRNPDNPPTSSFSRLEGLLQQAMEADRPRNIHSAEAARLAQLGAQGAAGLLGHKGYAELQRSRLEGREGRDGGGGERGSSGSGGRSGDRYGELPVAGDRVSSAVMGAYVQSYAGTGLARGTVQTFAQVGLERPLYNEFRKEGFNQAQIVDSARDSKALGWKGRDDLTTAQHATVEARKAGVATERAKTPQERAKGLAHERELEQQNEQRADSDPRKHHDRRYWHRRHDDWKRYEAKAGLGSAAKHAEKAGAVTSTQQDKLANKDITKSVISLKAQDNDDFGTSVAAPSKAAPVKTATVKPPAGLKPS